MGTNGHKRAGVPGMAARAHGSSVGSSRNMVKAREVLLVTADTMTRESAIAALRAAGYQTQAVTDVWVALRELQQKEYDLLVTDLHPPVLSALDLLHAVRSAGLSVPVVVLCEAGAEVPTEVLEAAGGVTVLDKPFSPTQIVEAARRALASANRGTT